MKVLHIGYSDFGGAGKGMLILHKALKNAGVDSKVLVANKVSYDEDIFCAEKNFNLYSYSSNKYLRFIQKSIRKRGWGLNQIDKYLNIIRQIPSPHSCFFSFPITNYDISQHPLVQEADIIHLHWIANFVDYPSFFSRINKPVVWTLRDENLAFGGFHYKQERDAFYNHYSTIEDAFCNIKRSSLEHCKKVHFVALSRMMKDFYASCPFLSDREITIIHNGIDTSLYRIFDKHIGRDIYHIPQNNYVIVFCSYHLNEKRKGLHELIEAISQLPRKDITLLCIGNGTYGGETQIDISYTGPITNEDLLAMTYSCGDVFALPSYQEAFAKTPLEAISCGLPVVAFPCSGMEELINEKNGVKCDNFSIQSLLNGLNLASCRSYDRQVLHNDIHERFSIDKIASKYRVLYDSLLTR